MKFTDNVTLSGTRETEDGYLVAEVRCARIGTQDYAGFEIGVDSPVVTVYRDEADVFAKDSLASFVGKPTTDDHPTEPVTADNWKNHAVGSIGEGVLRDGDYIKVPITLMDSAIIKKVKAGKAEISMGYTADMVFGDGVTPTGETYNAKQTNIRINHLAIVDAGRAGKNCRIGDNASPWGKSPIINDTGKTSMKTFVIDNRTVETTDTGLTVIQTMVDEKNAMAKQVADAATAKAEADKAKDIELAAKDAEIEKIKGEQLTDAQIDAKVEARASLLTQAKIIAKDAKFDGLSEDDIRKTAVIAVIGDEKVAGRSQAYIDARFDLLTEDSTEGVKDNFADSIKDRKQKAPDAADRGQSAYEERLKNAYKQSTQAPTQNTGA